MLRLWIYSQSHRQILLRCCKSQCESFSTNTLLSHVRMPCRQGLATGEIPQKQMTVMKKILWFLIHSSPRRWKLVGRRNKKCSSPATTSSAREVPSESSPPSSSFEEDDPSSCFICCWHCFEIVGVWIPSAIFDLNWLVSWFAISSQIHSTSHQPKTNSKTNLSSSAACSY